MTPCASLVAHQPWTALDQCEACAFEGVGPMEAFQAGRTWMGAGEMVAEQAWEDGDGKRASWELELAAGGGGKAGGGPWSCGADWTGGGCSGRGKGAVGCKNRGESIQSSFGYRK